MKWQTEVELERSNDGFFVGVPTDAWRYSDFLEHHGIKGMRWGYRTKEYQKKGYSDRYVGTDRQANPYAIRRAERQTVMKQEREKAERRKKIRKAAIIGAASAAALIAAYAGYKYVKTTKATAYANTLNRLLTDKKERFGTALDSSERIYRANHWAKSNSRTFKEARNYNKLFNQKLTKADKKGALRLYSARNNIDKFYGASYVKPKGAKGLAARRKMARNSAAWFRKTGIRV